MSISSIGSGGSGGSGSQSPVEVQKTKADEELRNLKRRQEAEVNRVKREGERELSTAQDYYRDTIYTTSKKTDQELEELKKKEAIQLQYTDKVGKNDVTALQKDHEKHVAELNENNERQISALNAQAIAKYEKMKDESTNGTELAHEKFQARYNNTIANDQKSIDALENKANEQLNTLRGSTAQKLTAYQSRQSDPFYKMEDIHGSLAEHEDKFVFTATIPRHEQDHVQVSVSGNQLIVSGNRRNEEKLDLSPGRFKNSSSFQSYQESFPLTASVEKHQLTKEFHGDQLTVTVPKSNQIPHDPYQATRHVDRLRAERPQFPGNLPEPEKPDQSRPLS